MPKRWLLACIFAGLAACLVAGAAAAWFWPVEAFTLRLPRQHGRLAGAALAGPHSRLTLAYIHSVEKGRVQGVFGAGPGPALLALETRMDSAGTGLPNAPAGRHQREGPWLVVKEKRRLTGGFNYILMPINHTRISVDQKELPLTGLKPGSVLLVNVESARLGPYLIWQAGGPAWPRRGEAK